MGAAILFFCFGYNHCYSIVIAVTVIRLALCCGCKVAKAAVCGVFQEYKQPGPPQPFPNPLPNPSPNPSPTPPRHFPNPSPTPLSDPPPTSQNTRTPLNKNPLTYLESALLLKAIRYCCFRYCPFLLTLLVASCCLNLSDSSCCLRCGASVLHCGTVVLGSPLPALTTSKRNIKTT